MASSPAGTASTYAGFRQRVGACLLDWGIVVVAAPVAAVAGAFVLNLVAVAVAGDAIDPSIELVAAVVAAGVAAFFWVGNSWGGTPGKRALGLGVINANTGEDLGLRRGLIRLIVAVLGAGPAFLPWLVCIRESAKQTWHDKVAGSIVVKLSGLPAGNPPRPSIQPGMPLTLQRPPQN